MIPNNEGSVDQYSWALTSLGTSATRARSLSRLFVRSAAAGRRTRRGLGGLASGLTPPPILVLSTRARVCALAEWESVATVIEGASASRFCGRSGAPPGTRDEGRGTASEPTMMQCGRWRGRGRERAPVMGASSHDVMGDT